VTSDPNINSWYNASTSILTATSIIGDLSDTTVDKTSLVAPNFNLQVQSSNARYFTYPNQANTNANFLISSSNFTTSWTDISNVTVNGPTLFTFNAANAYLGQYIGLCEPGRTYTFKFKIRNVSGNTTLQVRHLGSATGNYTPITIDGTLTEKTVTFLGPNPTALVRVGFEDQNVAGHGQVQVTDCHLRRDDHSDTLVVSPGNIPLYGVRDGIPVFGGGGQGPSTHVYWTQVVSRAMTQPFTIYMSYFPRAWVGGYIYTSNWPTLLKMVGSGGTTPNYYLGIYATPAWGYGTVSSPPLQWQVLTYQYNGATSRVRVNKNPADVVNIPNLAGTIDRLQYMGDSYAGSWQNNGDIHEIITRDVLDDTATQDAIIEWMACQVGLSV
jgi:hypothetical protein